MLAKVPGGISALGFPATASALHKAKTLEKTQGCINVVVGMEAESDCRRGTKTQRKEACYCRSTPWQLNDGLAEETAAGKDILDSAFRPAVNTQRTHQGLVQ